MIYLDNAATTPIRPEVLEAMMPYLTDSFGNPGAAYRLGRDAAAAVSNARKQVADFLNCEPEQIVFTSGATEANNMVFQGVQQYLLDFNKTHIISSATEHKSILNALDALKTKDGFDVTLLSPTNGFCVDGHSLESAITKETGLVSVMYVNNEVGFCNPVVEIASICADNDVLFHTDCVQAAGYFDLNVNEIGCDFMTVSSHKIGGPKGVGALYIKEPCIMSPMIYGGDSQEFGLRGGTENVASIVGFGEACKIAKTGLKVNEALFRRQHHAFMMRFAQTMEAHGYSGRDYMVNALKGSKAYKILSLTIPGIDAGTAQLMLDVKGICVSTGSACNSSDNEPSHVLKAIGFSDDDARSTLRISFSDDNTFLEIDDAAKELATVIDVIKTGGIYGRA